MSATATLTTVNVKYEVGNEARLGARLQKTPWSSSCGYLPQSKHSRASVSRLNGRLQPVMPNVRD
jgi:hypothetical protein